MVKDRRAITILVSVVLWASTFPLISRGLDYFPPMVMAVLRYGISLLPLFVFLLRNNTMKELWTILKDNWKVFTAIGLSVITFPQLFQNYGMLHVSPSVTSIIQTSGPVFGVIFGITLLKENVTWPKMVGVLIALFGAIVLATGGDLLGMGSGSSFWAFLILLSAIAYSSSGVFLKNILQKHDAITVTTLGIFVGTVLSIPFLLLPGEIDWFFAPTLSLEPMLIILYLATLPTGLAMVFWFRALAGMELSKITLFIYLIPVFATAFSILFFGDVLTPLMLFSGFLILVGVGLAQQTRWGRRSKDVN